MVAYIKGIVAYTDEDSVVIERDGIGYGIKSPVSTVNALHAGDNITLYTYMYVREDVIALYGFLTKEEQKVFVTLLGVSGIGPKAALAVLSTLSVEELYFAVFSEDVKAISKTPGIGPKGAKKMILELKDKLKLENLNAVSAIDQKTEVDSAVAASEVQDTIDALIALGYSSSDAYKAVRGVEGYQNMSADQLIKAALKHML